MKNRKTTTTTKVFSGFVKCNYYLWLFPLLFCLVNSCIQIANAPARLKCLPLCSVYVVSEPWISWMRRTTDTIDIGPPGSKVIHFFLSEGGLMTFWECLLQNWLYLFFLYERQRKHDTCFLLFYRTKQVAALFLSHHPPTLCWLTLTFD